MLKSFRGGIFSAVHLLFVLLLISGGVLLILSAYMKNVQNNFIHLLLEYPDFLFSVGLGISFFGIILLFGFYSMYKQRYYQIKMGVSKVLVEENIIADYIKNYWEEVFPNQLADLDVIIQPKGVIEIITKFPNQNSEMFLEKIQNELGLLLAKKLGYQKEFILTLLD
jgi:hypothetical protein